MTANGGDQKSVRISFLQMFNLGSTILLTLGYGVKSEHKNGN